VFILRFGAFSSICNIVNSTTDSDNTVTQTISSETGEVDGAMVYDRKIKKPKITSRREKKRDTKDRGDVVAMTVNKCVRAETVRLNTAKQTCYHNNNYYIIIIQRFISVVNDLVNRTEYTVQYVQQ